MNKNYLIIGLIILALIVIGVIAAQPNDGNLPGEENGVEENGETEDENGDTTTPSISVDDQEVSENGEVVLNEVVAEEDGFVVIHETNEEGETMPSESIGVAQVTAGTSEAVSVALDQEITADATLVAMLHIDSNGNGEYEFSGEETEVDTPVSAEGQVVAMPFVVTPPTEDEATEDENTENGTEVDAEAETEVDAGTE